MRVVTQEKTLYHFSELSQSAKEHAAATLNNHDDWWESTYEWVGDVAEAMGIDLRRKHVKLFGGGHRWAESIWFSGFFSQGDGACFESTYRYKKGAVKALKSVTSDEDVLSIAKRLQEVQRRHFYKLTATTAHRGHYNHSGCMQVDVEHYDDPCRDIGDAEDEVRDLLREFADWIYSRLEAEYDYLTSVEAVEEQAEANDYEFDERGELV